MNTLNDPQNPLRDQIQLEFGFDELVARDSAGEQVGEPYDGAGWPGDGSGTDDLADYNQLEAFDYCSE